MNNQYHATWAEILEALELIDSEDNTVYGVPRGGMIAAGFLKRAKNTPFPEKANIILDDIIDSGKTKKEYEEKYQGVSFVALFDKMGTDKNIGWVIFPWEAESPDITDNIVRILQYIGEDVNREGLLETPKRVVNSWKEIFSGYEQDPKALFKCFETDAYGGMVYKKNIEFFSTCEHHMLPFSGVAHIGYIPNGCYIGASKLGRLLDVYAQRLQIQERIAEQITTALMDYLNPLGAACVIEAKHNCIACRGVKKINSIYGYSSMKGAFMDNAAARTEFMMLIK